MQGSKIVYVLGAGFSIDAGAPSQERLVHKIFEVHAQNRLIFGDDKIEKFKNFLSDTLNIPENLHGDVPLEDIFTPIDRCLTDNLSFREHGVEQLKEIRGLVYYLIGKLLKHLLQGPQKEYIDTFAKYLVGESSNRANGNYRNIDPVSVLSTNWDIMLDTSIKQDIEDRFPNNAVVDYCCYISSFYPHDETVKPGLEMLGKGGFNVKYLKLHGSLNWLQCPACQRVYVDMSDKIAINQYEERHKCRHCQNNLGDSPSHELTSNLIMPTFLKNLNNTQYKLIWQNAGVELSEASKIVFIGYSLPMADFEMRQLLSRMVKTSAEIEVVSFSRSPDNDYNAIDLKKRYSVFFGKRKISFFWEGAKKYIMEKYSR